MTSKTTGHGKTIKVYLTKVKTDLPLFVLFRALGVITDKEICQYICYDVNSSKNKELLDLLNPSIEEAYKINNQITALEYISNHINFYHKGKPGTKTDAFKLKFTENTIREILLPHVGDDLFLQFHQLRTPRLLPLLAQHLVDCYPVKPGTEGALAPERIEFPPRLHERLLDTILGPWPVACHPQTEGVHPAFVAAIQRLEGASVAPRGLLHQQGLGYLRDRRPVRHPEGIRCRHGAGP